MEQVNYSKISQQPKVEEPVIEVNNEVIVEEVVNEPIVEGVVVSEPVTTEATVTEVTGVVVNCNKLNVRKEAKKESEVIVIINKNEQVTVNVTNSTEDFYKVTTATGIEGYCMKQFINVK